MQKRHWMRVVAHTYTHLRPNKGFECLFFIRKYLQRQYLEHFGTCIVYCLVSRDYCIYWCITVTDC